MGIPWLDVVLVVGLIYNLLKMIDLQFYAYYMSEKINLFDLVTYILFVPAFTSGPIMPYRAFNQQLYSYKEVDSISIEKFIKRIIRGLFKKIVIVKLFSYIYYSLLGLKINIFISILILMSYYILLYFDFAGYTDIAIGFGGLMGFDVPENFKKPFTSPTLTQFWRNWHATLGDWFRSHVFMPFAQFSQSRIFVGALSFMIMFLIGLWHGFNNLFILWGIYHGILLFLENVLNLTMVNKRKVKKSYFIFRCVATNTLVGFGTIFFSENIEIAKKILHGFTKLW
ncbi:MBOAT family O-acyltransferase [Gottschalkia purinilytica]|nr:MBOAT family O-acyltransferase [Gottschalkia purinilytica]